jgi:N-acetylglucosamine-6-phosphate deacetylase
VSDGVARLVSDGTIAGSILTLDAAVRHAVHVAGIPLADAVRAASQNPADMLGLSDVGRIEAGLKADLVVLSPELEVAAVMKEGRWLSLSKPAG